MPFAVGLTRQATLDATGDQDFRVAGMTTTPNVALFLLSNQPTNGVLDGATIGIGACDASAQWTMASKSFHGSATVQSDCHSNEVECIKTIKAQNSSASTECSATFVSFLADVGGGAGVRINWNDRPGDFFLMTVLLMSVDNVQVGTFAHSGTIDATIPVTTGFQPNLILFATTDQAFNDSDNVDHAVSIGACDASLNQYCVSAFDNDGEGVSNVFAEAMNNRIDSLISNDANARWRHEVTSIGATSFTVTQRNKGGFRKTGYIAMRITDKSVKVMPLDTATATGNKVYTGLGFKPDVVGMGLSLAEAYNTVYSDANSGTAGYGLMTSGAEYVTTVTVEDAADTTNTQNLINTKVLEIPQHNGTAQNVASKVSLDNDGFTLNYTGVKSGTAKKGYYWAVGEVVAAGRTTKNTDSHPLGIHTAMSWRVNAP
jgi:hypothetical protein